MGERRGTKALELWCRRITDGYPGVNVQNMTTSWRDGLAFCAMIHHFRPDLIDFDSLNKDDIYGNNELAFRIAEQHLGIPALLDAEDMASCAVPDRLSILTYLSQFYQSFGVSSPTRLALNRTTESSSERIAPVPESPKPKMGSRLGMRRDPCAVCGLPVFLAEKLVISRMHYHRTCFRCARCKNQLTPGNYYETEDGQYCCETCPDEEENNESRYNNEASIHNFNSNSPIQQDIFQKSLSDEEKIVKSSIVIDPEKLRSPQEISNNILSPLKKISSSDDDDDNDKMTSSSSSEISKKLRLNFMESHLLSEKFNELSVVDGPELLTSENSPEELSISPNCSTIDLLKKKLNFNDIVENISDPIKNDQRPTAISSHDIDNKCLDHKTNTKDLDGEATSSLVRQRLKIFENHDLKKKPQKADNVVKATLLKKDITSFFPSLEIDNQFENAIPRDNENLLSSSNHSELNDFNLETKKNNFKQLDSIEADFERLVESNLNQSVELDLKRLMESNFKKGSNSQDELNEKNFIQKNEEEKKGGEEEEEEEEEKKEEKETRDDVADSCKLVKPLSPIDNNDDIIATNAASCVSREIIIDDNYSKSNDVVQTELNLFTAKGINLSDVDDYPVALNPFADEDEQIPVKKNNSKISTNPFDSDENEEEEEEAISNKNSIPQAAERNSEMKIEKIQVKRRLKAPQISLNPFSSDDDDDETEGNTTGSVNFPIPKPRTINSLAISKANLERSGMYASNTSLASCGSTPGASSRKKKPAPQPPTKETLSPNSNPSTPKRNSSINTNTSPHMTPRLRKSKPAPPPPPLLTSTPQNESILSHINCNESSIQELIDEDDICKLNMWEDQKSNKDEVNRTRQSLSCLDNPSYVSYADKSVQGKWKRKKGPAPPRPVPLRRKIKVLSLKDIKLELDEIELQQQGLERQGVRLEQIIRDKSESKPIGEDPNIEADVEELVLELFVLVNEKNELFRRQAELMLLRRQQRLEEEHADVEYQIRCLLCQPEATKTDFDKQREETLIQRLVQIVERRNEIVECLEMDRKREVEEDRSINKHMGLYAAKGKSDTISDNDVNRPSKTKKGKLKEKIKEKKLKKSHKKDADKDVDEAEVKLKRHSKRKWF